MSKYSDVQSRDLLSKTFERSNSPLREEETETDDIAEIAQSIIDKKSFVWAIGQNKDGELGIGSQRDALLPRPIAT